MNPTCISEGFAPVGENGPQPVTLTVPIYNLTEVDLMGALEQVVQHFDNLTFEAKQRAVDWLHAKYGSDTP